MNFQHERIKLLYFVMSQVCINFVEINIKTPSIYFILFRIFPFHTQNFCAIFVKDTFYYLLLRKRKCNFLILSKYSNFPRVYLAFLRNRQNRVKIKSFCVCTRKNHVGVSCEDFLCKVWPDVLIITYSSS